MVPSLDKHNDFAWFPLIVPGGTSEVGGAALLAEAVISARLRPWAGAVGMR
jgi:hypothetical protein